MQKSEQEQIDEAFRLHQESPSVLFVSNEAYHADRNFVSSSRLKKIKRSPKAFKNAMEAEPEEKKCFDIGNAFECLILEPHLYNERFVTFDDTNFIERYMKKYPKAKQVRGTKAYKRMKSLFDYVNRNRTVLALEDVETLKKMVKSFDEHPRARALVKNAVVQASYFFDLHGVPFKSRPDATHPNALWNVDIKTARSADENDFIRSIANFGYGFQASTQMSALRAMGFDPKHYFWIVAETEGDCDCMVYELDPADLRYFDEVVEDVCEEYKECIESGEFPGLHSKANNPQGIKKLTLPAWAKK